MMEFSPQQKEASAKISQWLKAGDEQVFYLAGFAGTGKAQSVNSIVQTPHGPKKISELVVHSYIFAKDGSWQNVTGIFPQGIQKSYRMTFRDGSSTICNADHIWTVRRPGKEWKTKTTREIIAHGVRDKSGGYTFQIPLCDPVHYLSGSYEIPPYALGSLIGDGYLSGSIVSISSPKDKREILNKIETLIPDGMHINLFENRACPNATIKDSGYRNRWIQEIKRLGLNVKSPKRFIPKKYLMGDIPQRKDLLSGLMDTDGTTREGRTSYSTMSRNLANDIKTLVQSLGGTAMLRPPSKRDGEICVNIKTMFNPFQNCKKKVSSWKQPTKNPPSRYITKIEECGEEPHVCISVSSPDNLYLTDDFIVTHNTTIARKLAKQAKGKTVFAAYTGKAAVVMRKSGCHNANTIHSTIYKSARDEMTGKYRHRFNHAGVCADAGIIVIDECSMVGEDIGKDLLKYNRPILVLGDPAQLPPVKSGGFFTERNPNMMLTEIHRQAEGNPIIQLATMVRNGQRPAQNTYGQSAVIDTAAINTKDVKDADQVLVGRNNTRELYNDRLRELLELPEGLPVVGDRLVCLKNDHELGIFNGGIYKVIKLAPSTSRKMVSLIVQSDDFPDAAPVEVYVRKEFFTGGYKKIHWKELMETQQFTYGYALTVHKSQGSQWGSVLLFDQSEAFGDDWARHLYTGITRASEKVIIVQ